MDSFIENSDFTKSKKTTLLISAVVIIYFLSNSENTTELTLIFLKGISMNIKTIDWVLVIILIYQIVVFFLRSTRYISESKKNSSTNSL